MSSSQEIANYRAAAIVRLKAEHLENDTKIAQLEARNAEIRAQQGRFELPLPKPNLCPRCFYEEGMTTLMTGAPADPREPSVDRFQCVNGHTF